MLTYGCLLCLHEQLPCFSTGNTHCCEKKQNLWMGWSYDARKKNRWNGPLDLKLRRLWGRIIRDKRVETRACDGTEKQLSGYARLVRKGGLFQKWYIYLFLTNRGCLLPFTLALKTAVASKVFRISEISCTREADILWVWRSIVQKIRSIFNEYIRRNWKSWIF